MRQLAYDLHIHSALSPCGDDEMTPYNIAAMASVKKLDIISLADHNSAQNTGALTAAAREFGIAVCPAMEITSAEDVHVLAYFPAIDQAMDYSARIFGLIPEIPLNTNVFGNQLIMDSDGEPTGQIDKLLLTGVPLSVGQIFREVASLGGCCVFAHVDKPYNGVIAMLGMMPADVPTSVVEVSSRLNAAEYVRDNLGGAYRTLTSSDAHGLSLISEREYFIELEEASPECLIDWLKRAEP